MSAMRALSVVIVLGGCGGPDPSCKDAVTKASKLRQARDGEIAAMIEKCERQEWSGDLRRCIAGAADREAFAECMTHRPEERKDGLGDYRTRARGTEAQIQLTKIGKAAKVAYIERAAFPTEAAPLTPGTACCAENFQGKRRCGPSPSNWSAAAWRALDFEMSEPHFFRYSYTPSKDGTSFTATAVGDLDCDGVEITYVLRGSAVNGNPQMELVEPPPNSD